MTPIKLFCTRCKRFRQFFRWSDESLRCTFCRHDANAPAPQPPTPGKRLPSIAQVKP